MADLIITGENPGILNKVWERPSGAITECVECEVCHKPGYTTQGRVDLGYGGYVHYGCVRKLKQSSAV